MRQLQGDHGGEGYHHPGDKFGGVDQKLRVEQEDGAKVEVARFESVDDLPHDRNVCVQLNLT